MIGQSERDLLKKVFLSSLVVALTWISLAVFYWSSTIFLSALIGLGVATLLSPVVRQVERRVRVPRFALVVLLLMLIALVFMALFFFAGSVLVEQFSGLKDDLPRITEKWQSRWESLTEQYPQLREALMKAQPEGLAQTTAGFLGGFFITLSSALTGLSLAVVIALFTAVNSENYYQGFLAMFPPTQRSRVQQRLSLMAKTLRKWFTAQVIDMLVVGLLTTLGLWLVGINYWALYGVMAGVLSIIPYVGLLLTVAFAGAVVLVMRPEKFWLLLLVFFITQQLEGNYILPKLMKRQVQTPAALLIFSMILAGSWFGILGVFVTPPLLALTLALSNNQALKEAG